MKRKFIPLILSVSMIGMLLPGCSNSQQSQGESSSEVESETGETGTLESGTVTLKVWAGDSSMDTVAELIEGFKEHYAGQADFDITLEEQSEDNTRNTLLGDINNGADVFVFPDDQLSSMIAGGALEPVPNAEEIGAANIDEATAAATYNGVLYAYPLTADNGYFLYYNKEYLSETDVQTMDGILAVAQAQGKSFAMDFTSGWYLYSFFGGTGLDFGINDDGVTNHCNWNTTEGDITGVDIAQAILDITTNPGFKNMSNDDFIAGAQDDSVIAGVGGVWNAMAIKAAWGDDYGAVKLPTYTVDGQQIQMSSFTGYKMLGVNYYSDHKEWALKLAEWLSNEESQSVRFTELNQGPSNKNVAASDELLNVPAIQAVIAQAEFGVLQRVGNSYWDPCTAFGATMAAGNPENAKLQAIMDTLVAGITASVAQ